VQPLGRERTRRREQACAGGARSSFAGPSPVAGGRVRSSTGQMTNRHDEVVSGRHGGTMPTTSLPRGRPNRRSRRAQRASAGSHRAIVARDAPLDRLISPRHPIRGQRVGRVRPGLRPTASATLRSFALVALAMLLILILLPAVLAAAAQAPSLA
jgi:hypothetical protein